MEFKVCSRCKKELPADVDHFYRNKRSKDGIDSWCKGCVNAAYAKWYKNNKEKKAEYDRWYRKKYYQKNKDTLPYTQRKNNLKTKYNITPEDYDTMFKGQGGKCKICGKRQSELRLCVDHCHTTGIVRGLLCMKCNTAIGKLNDDPILTQRATDYLKGEL